MYYWESFEKILTAFMKLALLTKWDYPIRRQDDEQNKPTEKETKV